MKEKARAQIIGREKELDRIERLLNSEEAEFVAVYGRRRVGKTFLIDRAFSDNMVFSFTATENAATSVQLQHWADTLLSCSKKTIEVPKDWQEAFNQLKDHISSLPNKNKKVIFIDEMPWLDRPRSKFIPALSYFWNSWASKRSDIVLVGCGSATSWMTAKLINNHGGLHNRLTCTLKIQPFTLKETKAYLEAHNINWSQEMIAECYMTFGGIPYYLRLLDERLSLAQNIDQLIFSISGELRNEFRNLYKSLFRCSDVYIRIITILNKTKMGMTREEIAQKAGIPLNGKFSQMLQDLIDCDFIRRSQPIGKVKKNSMYQLVDFFTLFHFRFIADAINTSNDYWVKQHSKRDYAIWCGLAFEMLVLQHKEEVLKALNIAGINCKAYSWVAQKTEEHPGAQIDLVIDRDDKTITLCEIKYTDAPFTLNQKSRDEIETKLKVFKEETGTKKSVQMIMVSANGLKKNSFSASISKTIDLADLFK